MSCGEPLLLPQKRPESHSRAATGKGVRSVPDVVSRDPHVGPHGALKVEPPVSAALFLDCRPAVGRVAKDA